MLKQLLTSHRLGSKLGLMLMNARLQDRAEAESAARILHAAILRTERFSSFFPRQLFQLFHLLFEIFWPFFMNSTRRNLYQKSIQMESKIMRAKKWSQVKWIFSPFDWQRFSPRVGKPKLNTFYSIFSSGFLLPENCAKIRWNTRIVNKLLETFHLAFCGFLSFSLSTNQTTTIE